MLRNPKFETPNVNRTAIFRTEDNEWHVGSYHKGYWFDKTEIEIPVTAWLYAEDMEKEEIRTLINRVSQWHHARNLVFGSDPKSQFVKLIEEAGELAGAIARNQDVRDHIGDILVVLILIGLQCGVDLAECLAVAYDDIKDRKGTMIDGVFVKEQDMIGVGAHEKGELLKS